MISHINQSVKIDALFNEQGYKLIASDYGKKTARRYIHCKMKENSSGKLYFAKIARTKQLVKNLERESLLVNKAQNFPKKIKLTTYKKRIHKNIFIYEYIPTKRMSDIFDQLKGRINSSAIKNLSMLAVEFSYLQTKINYKPVEMFLDIKKFEKELVAKAERSPIYRRSELLTCYNKLNKSNKIYRYEIGDFQLQNLVFIEKPATLILFDLEAWSLFRAHWSLASLFTISWFRQFGEKFSKELYKMFLKHPKSSKKEQANFLLCCLYFVFIYYPSYSKRSSRYRKHFQKLIDWILEECIITYQAPSAPNHQTRH